ncbi:MAG: TfpX/TfpZ family type IV pilin accessory protein [Pseudomonadota bacterium]
MKLISANEFAIKAKAAFIHFLLTVFIAGIAAYIVFGIWFPYPYSQISGGRNLFWLVIWVDICCGPLLTFVLFNIKKSRKELTLDLSLVAIIQLAALFYGVYTVMLARPVYLVFEVDRMRVVSFADVLVEELPLAKNEFQTIPFFSGPGIIAAKLPEAQDKDFLRTFDLAMQGIDISSRPQYWVPYSESAVDILKRAKSIKALKLKNPNELTLITAAINETNIAEDGLLYLPLQSRTAYDWVALLDAKNANIVGFAHVDGF